MSEEVKGKVKKYQRKRYQQLIQYNNESLQSKSFCFTSCMKMSEKALKFDNTSVNKNEFHKSKQPIDSDLINVDEIVMSDRFKHSDDGFKHFIRYKEDDIVRPLCFILSQMRGYIKYFENGGTNMSFMTENDDVLLKYNET